MRHTSIFIFSLFVGLSGLAQKPADSAAVKTERYGIRVGADLYKLARSVYDKDYRGFEVVADYRFSKKMYLAGEIGNEKKTTDDDRLNFTTSGSYFKAGFDYNTYENWLGMENLIHVGLRYGVSSFSQTLNSYEVYNPYPYLGEAPTVVSGQEFKGLTASWAEVVAGIKVEVFDNIFVGFSARLNRIVTNKQPDNFANLYIPGFNRTYDGDFGVGFNYTLSYFVPIYKKKVLPQEKPEKK